MIMTENPLRQSTFRLQFHSKVNCFVQVNVKCNEIIRSVMFSAKAVLSTGVCSLQIEKHGSRQQARVGC